MKKVFLFGIILMLVLCIPISAAKKTDDIYLYVGSPIAISQGETLPLDTQNPKLTPIIYKSRTLVPLRMIGEFFGAEVDYDAVARAAVIKINDNTAKFPISESYFTLNGEKITLDTETLIQDGRTLVPLRAISEQVLGLEVDYLDKVIYIGTKADLTKDKAEDVTARIGGFIRVQDFEAYAKLWNENADKYYNYMYVTDEMAVADSVEAVEQESAPEAPSGSNNSGSDDGAGSGDYSQTNVQVEGIDEGDIIKTDGKYVYACSGSLVKIIGVNAGEMKLAAELELKEGTINEMYVDGNYLVLTGYRYNYPTNIRGAGSYASEVFSFVEVYDISNLDSITRTRVYEVEGYATASRKQGDWLYVLTSTYRYPGVGIDPRPIICEDGEYSLLPASDVIVQNGFYSTNMTTLSAINIKDNSLPVTKESIIGGGGESYMSQNAFYVTGYAADSYYDTQVSRFNIDKGMVSYRGSGVVNGALNDQFSMDEYSGYLRIATSTFDRGQKNNLYILNESMEVTGSVLGFAPDERIYSARFMGDRGYVVTFRETDPLFVFDLSNPANPKITGELKVPGFSEYLHPISENILLGIGREVIDVYYENSAGEKVVTSQMTAGLKLSLFDVSDAGRPKEIDTLVLGDYGYSEVLSNHKAAMFCTRDSILAIPASVTFTANDKTANTFEGIYVINYDANNLEKIAELAVLDTYATGGVTGTLMRFGNRTVYVGNVLYYMQNGMLRAFDMKDYSTLGQLMLYEGDPKQTVAPYMN